MHVRIAWEILHHQKKENPDKNTTIPSLSKPASTPEMHRPPSHIFPSSSVISRPPELTSAFPANLPRQYEANSIAAAGYLTGPTSHLGNTNAMANFSIFFLDFISFNK